jgi:hypothetical protein
MAKRTQKTEVARVSISDAAKLLDVTPVRVHGLIKANQLIKGDPIKVGNKDLSSVTQESIDALIARRAEGRAVGTRQYILTLSAEQVAELEQAGYELRPRFVKKASNDQNDSDVSGDSDELDESDEQAEEDAATE